MSAEVIGLIIGCTVIAGIAYIVGRYGNTPTQEKLAEAQKRIDMLTLENEDLTKSWQDLLGQKDIWKKSGELVKNQAQRIKDCEAQIDGLNKLLDDQKAKLDKANARADSLKDAINDLKLYVSLIPAFWKKTIDKYFKEAKCKADK